jgi:L-lactate dehydrogenase complex protein LldG
MTTARAEVLGRIRGALGDDPTALPVPRDYRTHGEYAAASSELVTQLVDRLEDYRATVVRTGGGDEEIGTAIAHALAAQGLDEAIAPAGVPAAWLHGIPAHRTDDGSATPRDLDRTPAVVTGSTVTISETGTIVLDGSPLCGRRAITLVPDTHVCVVRTDDIVQTVPEGLARLDPTRPITLISGPSATSDIELSRVEGVHGPRTLIVVLAG